MNKNKKIAVAVISTVMAGTMALSLTACGPSQETGPKTDGNITKLLNHMTDSGAQLRENALASGWNTAKNYWNYLGGSSSTAIKDEYGVLDSNGNLNYNVYKDRGNVTLNISIGHNSAATSTSFQTLGATITLPDGKSYNATSMKPAWAQMGSDLNITWNDIYTGKQTNANLKDLLTTNATGSQDKLYSTVDMFTTDLSYAVEYAASGTDILNLADYLDYMPNFRAFLEENPIVYLSLLQAGMDTTTGENKTLYVAPYFDGNDDIERYCLVRQDWVEKLLNGTDNLPDAGTTFEASCGEGQDKGKVAAESYMQKTGKLEIESTNSSGTGKVTIVKDYDAALTAAKSESTALGAAYKAIANAAYSGDSGNIVDIMNAALTANKGATGSQLVALYRAYIDVCYQEKGQSGSYFTATERANLFNGYDACWDVDDLVAILRCVKTNASTLLKTGNTTIQGIVPRSGQNDRTPDMVRLAAQLYGVRGADSRYEYTYIDNAGNLQDARNDAEFYQALVNLNKLKKEGLVGDYSGIASFSYTGGISDNAEAFMMYDYNQTQTKQDYYVEDTTLTGGSVSNEYRFAPVVTPVAKWDVDGDGNHTDVMRFTESWRSTKTSGLAVNGAVKNDAKKLQAVLQFIDYLYSEDGQIVSTYGPKAENSGGTNGFWYNTEASSAEVTAGNYFTYKGVKYSGTLYKGKTTPTVTDSLYQSFLGKEVNGWKVGSNDNTKAAALSFTDYARRVVGSTLPVGVKDQSFENQLTSKTGAAGANKVGVGLANGTVKGMSLAMNSNNWWYTCVPTGLPVSSSIVNSVLNHSSQNHLRYLSGVQKDNKNFISIFNYIILHGTSGTYNQQDETYSF